MGADGSDQTALPEVSGNAVFNPRWSPDGHFIALLQYDSTKRGRLAPGVGHGVDQPLLGVIVMHVATGDVHRVGQRVPSFDNPVSWLPDGDSLLINRYDSEG
jgi:hypothetical protein